MDTDLEIGFYTSVSVAAVAGTTAGGLYVAGVNPVIWGGTTATATGAGTGVLSRAALQAALTDARAQLNWWVIQYEFMTVGSVMAAKAAERIAYWRSEISYLEYALQQLAN